MPWFKAALQVFLALSAWGLNAHATDDNVGTVYYAIPTLSRTVPFDGVWSVETGLSEFKEGRDQGDAAFIRYRTNLQLNLAPWIFLRLDPRVDYYSARVQTRFDDTEYQTGLKVSQGIVDIQPIEQIDLKAGMINQGFWHQPMMLSDRRSFPGAEEVGNLKLMNNLKIQAAAEQVVPTSYSVDSEREDKEALPALRIEMLSLGGQNFGFLNWTLMGGHYQWANPPDKVAFAAAQMGNSVDGEVAPGAHFKFGFEGWLAGAEVCVCQSQSWIQGVAELKRFSNRMADSGLGDAQSWGFGPRVIWGENVLDMRYHRFFIEKDATIAGYQRNGFDGTNRQGDDVELKLDFKKYKFSVVGEWIGTTILRDNPVQFSHNAFFIGIETDYARYF